LQESPVINILTVKSKQLRLVQPVRFSGKSMVGLQQWGLGLAWLGLAPDDAAWHCFPLVDIALLPRHDEFWPLAPPIRHRKT